MWVSDFLYVPVMWGSAFFHVGFRLPTSTCDVRFSFLRSEVQSSSMWDSDYIYLRFLLPLHEWKSDLFHVRFMKSSSIWGSYFLHMRIILPLCAVRTSSIWGLDILQVKFCLILIVQWHSPNEKRCPFKFKEIFVKMWNKNPLHEENIKMREMVGGQSSRSGHISYLYKYCDQAPQKLNF